MVSSSSADVTERSGAYGQHRRLTPVDRFGVWLVGSGPSEARPDLHRQGDRRLRLRLRRTVRPHPVLDEVGHATLVDLALAPDLKEDRRVTAIEGTLPECARVDRRGLARRRALDLRARASLGSGRTPSRASAGRRPRRRLPRQRPELARQARTSSCPRGSASARPRRSETTRPTTTRATSGPCWSRPAFSPGDIECYKHKFGLNTFAVCKVPR